MSKLFYDHLINLEKIHDLLDAYDLTNTEKKELLKTIDETIHHEVLNVILTYLPNEHHEEFLEGFANEPFHEKHIVYLNERVDIDVEKELQKVIDEMIKVISEDLRSENDS